MARASIKVPMQCMDTCLQKERRQIESFNFKYTHYHKEIDHKERLSSLSFNINKNTQHKRIKVSLSFKKKQNLTTKSKACVGLPNGFQLIK